MRWCCNRPWSHAVVLLEDCCCECCGLWPTERCLQQRPACRPPPTAPGPAWTMGPTMYYCNYSGDTIVSQLLKYQKKFLFFLAFFDSVLCQTPHYTSSRFTASLLPSKWEDGLRDTFICNEEVFLEDLQFIFLHHMSERSWRQMDVCSKFQPI